MSIPALTKYRMTKSATLRFIEKDGEKVLQESIEYLEYENGELVDCGAEWTDIPTLKG